MTADELLRRMRDCAAAAREGVDVRSNERQLRWAFEQLDGMLSGGRPLPEEWARI